MNDAKTWQQVTAWVNQVCQYDAREATRDPSPTNKLMDAQGRANAWQVVAETLWARLQEQHRVLTEIRLAGEAKAEFETVLRAEFDDPFGPDEVDCSAPDIAEEAMAFICREGGCELIEPIKCPVSIDIARVDRNYAAVLDGDEEIIGLFRLADAHDIARRLNAFDAREAVINAATALCEPFDDASVPLGQMTLVRTDEYDALCAALAAAKGGQS
jgi:hypothetical protein